jgi:pimeloyl-ACP methyl ester carboxylesterase
MLKFILIRALFIALAVYIGLGIYMFVFQRKYIYFPDNRDFNSCHGFKTAEIINFNGTRGYYKKNGDKLIVFYHGNAGSACDRAFIKDEFEKFGYSYLFVEYAGYSGDNKKPSKELLMQDVRNINEFLKTIDYSKLFLAGESIGTSFALYHSTIADEDKVLLIAPYDSITRVAQIHYPYYPVKLILRDKYDNSRWIDGIKNIMIIHGSKDSIIPVSEGRSLFNKIKTKDKIFTEIEGASHNSLFYYPETFLAISDYLEE